MDLNYILPCDKTREIVQKNSDFDRYSLKRKLEKLFFRF